VKAHISVAVLTLLSLSLFTGCVANQKLLYSYSPMEANDKKINGPVEVSVKDEREFIVNGNKDASYVGHFRAGFGNTWDVKTKGEIALAEQFQTDLQKELAALGASNQSPDSKKILHLTIVQYNFDAYINGRFFYKFLVSVSDANDQLLAEDVIENEEIILGSFWLGPVGAFKSQMPILHAGIIRKLVRDNNKILDVLKS